MNMDPNFFFPAPRRQNFCGQCGHSITRLIPPGDNRERDLCEKCGAISYQNPRVVVGTMPILGDKVLLCLRAIEPSANTWTLPAGFMELSETLGQGAERETQEEAGADIELGHLYTTIDIPQADQIHIYFLATALSAKLDPGPETIEARWFDLDDIPWDNLSFRSVSTTLKHYLRDRETGQFGPHHYALAANRG